MYHLLLQWQIQGRGLGHLPPFLFLDQTEAQRAEKIFFGDRPSPDFPYLRVKHGALLKPIPGHFQLIPQVPQEWSKNTLLITLSCFSSFLSIIYHTNSPCYAWNTCCDTELIPNLSTLIFTDNWFMFPALLKAVGLPCLGRDFTRPKVSVQERAVTQYRFRNGIAMHCPTS